MWQTRRNTEMLKFLINKPNDSTKILRKRDKGGRGGREKERERKREREGKGRKESKEGRKEGRPVACAPAPVNRRSRGIQGNEE